jgi:hypothetical protein
VLATDRNRQRHARRTTEDRRSCSSRPGLTNLVHLTEDSAHWTHSAAIPGCGESHQPPSVVASESLRWVRFFNAVQKAHVRLLYVTRSVADQ